MCVSCITGNLAWFLPLLLLGFLIGLLVGWWIWHRYKKHKLRIEGEYNGLSSRYNSLEGNYNQTKNDYATLEGTYSGLQSNFTKVQTERNQLSTDFGGLQKRYDTEKVDWNSRYSTLQGENTKLKGDYGTLQKEYEAYKKDWSAKYSNLEKSNAKLKGDYDTLQKDYTKYKLDWSSKYKTLEDAKAKLQGDYDKLSSDWTTKYKALEDAKAKLQGDYDKLQLDWTNKYKTLEDTNAKTNAELEALRAEYSKYKMDIANKLQLAEQGKANAETELNKYKGEIAGKLQDAETKASDWASKLTLFQKEKDTEMMSLKTGFVQQMDAQKPELALLKKEKSDLEDGFAYYKEQLKEDYEGKLAALQSDMDAAKKDDSDRYQVLLLKFNDLEKEKQAESKRLSELDAAVNSWKLKYSELENEQTALAADLKSKSANTGEDLDKSEEKYKALLLKYNELERAKSEISNRFIILEKSKATADAENKNQLSLMSGKLKEAEENGASDEELAQLNNQLKVAQLNWTNWQKRYDLLAAQQKDAEANSNETQKAVAQADERYKVLLLKFNQLDKDKREADEKIKKATNEKAELDKRYEIATNNLRSWQVKYNNVNEERKNDESRFKKATLQSDDLRARLDAAAKKLAESNAKLAGLEKDRANIEGAQKGYLGRIKELETANNSLTLNFNAAKAGGDDNKALLQQLQATKIKLEFDLEAARKNAAEAAKSAEKQTAGALGKVNDLEKANADLKNQLNALKSSADNNANASKQYANQVQALQDAKRKLEADLKAAQQQVADADRNKQQSAKDNAAKVANLEKANADLKAKLNNLDADVKNAKNASNDYASKVKELEAVNGKLDIELQKALKEAGDGKANQVALNDLKVKLTRLDEDRATLGFAQQQAKAQALKAEESNKSLADKLSKLDKERAELSADQQKYKAEAIALKEQMAEVVADRKSLASKLSKLDDERAKLAANQQQYKAEAIALKEQMEGANADKKSLASKLSKLDDERAKIAAAQQKAKEEALTLKEQIADLKDTKKEAEKAQRGAEQALKAYTAKATKSGGDDAKLKAQVTELKGEKSSLQDELKRLNELYRNESANAFRDMESYKMRYETLLKAQESRNMVVRELEEDRDGLTKEIESLKALVAKGGASGLSYKEMYESLAESSQNYELIITDLEKRLAEYRGNTATTNLATGSKKEKDDVVLKRIQAKAKAIDFGRIGKATAAKKDDLKEIKGVGPFTERKLNALGIYTFMQMAKLNAKDQDMVNDAIEFFPGRVKRDDWVGQARVLAGLEKPKAKKEAKTKTTTTAKAKPATKVTKKVATAGGSEKDVLSRIASGKSKVDFGKIGTATAAKKDDLTFINGIGDVYQARFYSIGIYTYEQLGNFRKSDMKLVNGLLEMPEDIIDEGDWCAQAKKLGQYKATGKSGKEIKKYASLVRVAARSKDMDFDRIGLATTAEKDDLQRIKGVGPFLEEKVNALGIYTFAQIGRFNKGDVQLVNDAIEFFPGRIERDEWVKQAKVLAKEAKKANK